MEPLLDAPIATYRENTAFRRQTVSLFADRVDVHTSVSLSTEADWSCPLTMLAPQFQTGRQRDSNFSLGLGLLGVWVVALTVIWQMSSLSLDSPQAALFWAAPVLFITIMLTSLAKRPFVVVHSADGAPLFTIVKNYPDGKRFGAFTEMLLSRIREAHRQPSLAAEAFAGSAAKAAAPN